ncbi:MAG: redox-sensing transcriptional repressor Rex [Anaerolineaceae bacterium]|nr:redox-sensing transcriptional repressor Rex [Anaerolineaceae bacterium]
MAEKNIPSIVISRLPKYLITLERLSAMGVENTSSGELGALLNITPAQIRKDLSFFGGFGKKGSGYAIPHLINSIRSILNLDSVWDVAIIGAGKIGQALALYEGFLNRGFSNKILFDADPQKIGQKIGNCQVFDIKNLKEKLREYDIKVALLAVPQVHAQEVADQLVQAGIKAILNYTPVYLTCPNDEVYVQQIDPILQLQHMTYYLK